MMEEKNQFNYRSALSYTRRKHMRFSEWVDEFLSKPDKHLNTSSTLIAEAIKHFGYKIVIRSGEPVVSFNIFKDIFSNGVNAVYGQEIAIKRMVDVIESISKESGPNRGIVLVGPPASGKTNIVDLISLALEEYTKQSEMKLYSFYYHFTDINNPDKTVQIRSSLIHNPILFFTTVIHHESGIRRPRQELLESINKNRSIDDKVSIPTYYQNASLDKRNLDILEGLIQNEINRGKSLFDIIEEYVRIEEVEFSNAQGKGVSNIDSLKKLDISVSPVPTRDDAMKILNQHLPTIHFYRYEGALVSANRGLLHLHDAFVGSHNEEYQPLLMLLGSGRVSLESTQAAIDTVVVITTNNEDMEEINNHLKTSKLLDRIERVPVNYLLDAYSEMDILKRDMAIMQEKYDVDPNLFKIASYFSVMTRLLPPNTDALPENWSDEKRDLYASLGPEQKLFIYAARPNNPMDVIRSLPYWHSFRNQASKLGVDLYDEDSVMSLLEVPVEAPTLESCGVFTAEQIKLIDAEFMRELKKEYTLDEGKFGISIRQLQNIMRNTISNSDGRAILVNNFIMQIEQVIDEGEELHHWLADMDAYKKNRKVPKRKVGELEFVEGEGDYGNFKEMIDVLKALYYMTIKKEVVTSTVDRDPIQIESDLRKYIQSVLLFQAIENKAFAHVMVPKFSYIDPVTGIKVNKPDDNFMRTIEEIISPNKEFIKYRRSVAQKYFDLVDQKQINIEKGKTVINSRSDNFIQCFDKEFNKMLSHRKTEEGIDSNVLSIAFYKKQYEPEEYLKMNKEVRTFVETVVHNMSHRYRYSHKIATETIVFALREKIVDFKTILN